MFKTQNKSKQIDSFLVLEIIVIELRKTSVTKQYAINSNQSE